MNLCRRLRPQLEARAFVDQNLDFQVVTIKKTTGGSEDSDNGKVAIGVDRTQYLEWKRRLAKGNHRPACLSGYLQIEGALQW